MPQVTMIIGIWTVIMEITGSFNINNYYKYFINYVNKRYVFKKKKKIYWLILNHI